MSAENTQCRMAVNVTPVLGEVQLVAGPQLVAIGLTQPDARRLAACWNASRNLTTEALENYDRAIDAGYVPQIDHLHEVHNHFVYDQMKRDDEARAKLRTELAAARALLRDLAADDVANGELSPVLMARIRELAGDA